MKTNPDLTEKIVDAVNAAATRLRDIAGHNGSFDDGGAASLESDLEMWQCGLRGDIPSAWEEFIVEEDPEWEEYQRLRTKFEGQE